MKKISIQIQLELNPKNYKLVLDKKLKTKAETFNLLLALRKNKFKDQKKKRRNCIYKKMNQLMQIDYFKKRIKILN